MSNVEIKETGSLKDKAAIERLLSVVLTPFKGVLIFGRAKEKKSFIIENGKPYLPGSVLSEAVFGKMLFEKNLINADQFKKIKEIETSGKTFFQAVIESGFVPKDEIFNLILAQWIEDLAVVFSWDAGQFACVEFLPKEVVKIEIERKIQYYIYRALLIKNKKIKSKFSPSARFVMNTNKTSDLLPEDLGLNDSEKKIVESLKLSKPIRTVALELKILEATVSPIVFSLREIELLSTDSDKKPTAQASAYVPPVVVDESGFDDEQDFLKKLKMVDDMDFYEILGVSREFSLPVLQAKYFMLAKKYHPDRVKTKVNVDKKDVEKFFIKITEAYNTLSNERLRIEYEEKSSRNAKKTQALVSKVLESEGVFLDGNNLLSKGLFGEAVKKYREAIEMYNEEPEYLVKLGWALFRLGIKEKKQEEIVEAKKILTEAYNKKQHLADVSYYLGMIAKSESKSDQAMTYFRNCLKQDPDYALAGSELRLLERKKK